jgi:hypothetical protein
MKDKMSDHHGRNVGLRAGTVTGSWPGVGNHRSTTTAPPDNLPAIIRDATIMVDGGVRLAVTLHMKPQQRRFKAAARGPSSPS